MAFDTAILYDIENLLKGYAFSQRILENLSLQEIVDSIKGAEGVGQIAVQRAYANWSDPRLGVMRGEINSLGIDPIQVFGFSRDQKKNAADIQLAVDAIDLAHVRPSIRVFVIVSGDGGFTALAKKLHEYGKTVIGCAYENAANRVFRAVCDIFLPIPDPENGEEEESRPVRKSEPARPADSPLSRMKAKVQPLAQATPERVRVQAVKVLKWMATDPELARSLSTTGVSLPVVKELIDYAVVNFQPVIFGHVKFKEALQCLCREAGLHLLCRPPSEIRLTTRGVKLDGFDPLPDLEMQSLVSEQGYRSVLASGEIRYRLPGPADLQRVAELLAEWRPEKLRFGESLEEATRALEGRVMAGSVKAALLSLLAAGLFVCEPEGAALPEAILTLRPEFRSAGAILGKLAQACRQKIGALGLPVNEQVLAGIIFGEAGGPA